MRRKRISPRLNRYAKDRSEIDNIFAAVFRSYRSRCSIPCCSLPCSLACFAHFQNRICPRTFYGDELTRPSNRSKRIWAIEKPPVWGLYVFSGLLLMRRLCHRKLRRHVGTRQMAGRSAAEHAAAAFTTSRISAFRFSPGTYPIAFGQRRTSFQVSAQTSWEPSAAFAIPHRAWPVAAPSLSVALVSALRLGVELISRYPAPCVLLGRTRLAVKPE